MDRPARIAPPLYGMTAQRFLLAALIASLAGCGIGRNDRLDQVRDFRIEWSNPRLADLNYALDTCRVWGMSARTPRTARNEMRRHGQS